MKAFGLVSILLVCAIAGYLVMVQMKGGPQVPGVEASPNMAKMEEDRAKAAVQTADLAVVRTLVRSFEAAHGRLPASLDELKTAGMIDSIPANLTYDPKTGQVNQSAP